MIRYNALEAASIREKILARVKTDVAACYQCGNCSAGCPAAFTFDYAPNQVMRMLQVGLVDEVLKSSAVQNCIQCLTCTARCPRNIDIAGIFEDLKTIAAARNLDVPEHARTFNRLFLENIAKYGRLTEATFLVRFNMAARKPMNDADLGMPMLSKGKIEIVPRKAKGADEVGRIYRKAMEKAKWHG
ncbi:MAG: 4Fe-4S dicluster domain-containing protein [Thermoleophilia bacterium]